MTLLSQQTPLFTFLKKWFRQLEATVSPNNLTSVLQQTDRRATRLIMEIIPLKIIIVLYNPYVPLPGKALKAMHKINSGSVKSPRVIVVPPYHTARSGSVGLKNSFVHSTSGIGTHQ